MARKSAFSSEYSWFKGNLHSHSTRSDGKLDPPQVVELYRSNGWDFIAFTEHEFYSYWQELSSDDFLVLPGIEMGLDIPKFGRCHHLLGIHKSGNGAKHLVKAPPAERDGMAGAQEEIYRLGKEGYLTIYCHPLWSRVEWEDISELRGFTAIEIYNHSSEMENHSGLHLDHWDSFLRRGIKVWGVATDDSHHWMEDYCGGWIMVNAPQLTVADLTEALVAGRFYSSTGPTITDFGLDGDEVYIECSPAKAIHIVTYEPWGRSFYAEPGKSISSAVHRVRGNEIFVRAEVVDSNGKTAWTNPIFLDKKA
ncbi:MAG: CehA/McbA family metallohydrolase [Limnochordia bacterium]